MDIKFRVYRNFIKHVTKEDVQIDTVLDILRSLVLVVNDFSHLSQTEKKALIIDTFHDIAAGKDGILGTADDVIAPNIVKGIDMLIECNLVSAVIDLIIEATHARTGLTASMYLCELLSYCCCCTPSKKEDPLLG